MVLKAIHVEASSRRVMMASLVPAVEAIPEKRSEWKDADEYDFDDVFGPVVVLDGEEAAIVEYVTEADCSSFKARCSQLSLVGPGVSGQISRSLRDGGQEIMKNTEDDLKEAELLTSPGEGSAEERLGPEDFELLACVGQGGFAKVFLCKKNGTDESYAMKVMTKSKIMGKNHGSYVKAERDILTKIVHPFIVQLQYSFQTSTKLYLILDFINGGHLFFQLYKQGIFCEDLARIYTAEIVCAVGHLHSLGIMHRDLKPENILLDAEGHVKITDFGLAKVVDESKKSNSFCGTVEYMAPEVIEAKGHGRPADWWSVGILLYEMLTGRPPFHGNRSKLQERIVKERIKWPKHLTSDAINLLKGLLQKDPSKRLGSGPKGTAEIKDHKFFKTLVWRKVLAREVQPKFKPTVAGIRCIANFDDIWTKMSLLDSPTATTPKAVDDNFFQGFSYTAPSSLRRTPPSLRNL